MEIWILVVCLSVLDFVGQVIDKASADSSETSVRLFFLCISSMVGDVLSPKMSHPWSKQALKQNNSLYDLYAIKLPLIVIRRWIIHKEEDYKKGKQLLTHWQESRSRESG